MEYQFPSNVRSVRPSLIREFSNNVKQYKDAIDLTLGQPDFPTPERVKQAGIKAILENHTGYTKNDGIAELRQAAAKYLKEQSHVTYDPEWEIMVTCGATEAVDVAFRTILSGGDDVLIPAPAYAGYEPLIRFCGAVPKYIDTRDNDFILTAEMLDQAYTPYSRCLLLTYPNNPTGATLNKAQMDEIVAWLEKHPDIYVITDEIYSALTFEGSHISIASYPSIWSRCILISGVSKAYSMTGWRIGFLCAPIKISDELYKVHQMEVTCATSISQYAALEALKSDAESKEMCREYVKRSTYLYEELKKMGISVSRPKGAFYIFPSIKKFGLSSYDFCTKLLKEAHIGCVPGNAFSTYGEGYIRISTASSMAQLKEFADRFGRFISEFEAKEE